MSSKLLFLTLVIFCISTYALAYSISGYVFVPPGIYASSGKVLLYDVATGGLAIDDTCLNSNHNYTFTDLAPDTYYVYVKAAYYCNGVSSTNIYRSASRIMVIITDSDKSQNLTASTDT